jgi:hypothetical protein
MTVGPQLGAGIGSQPGGFATQGGQNTAPAPGLPAPGSTTGGTLSTIAPGVGFGASTSGTTNAPSPAVSPSTAVQATPPRTASPIVIDAPAAPATAAVSGADAAGISDGALGVVIEGMMLSDVVDVDRERSCITLRSPDGTIASYRFTSAKTDRVVAVGDQVVIEVRRPLLASTPEAPSASPHMSGPSRAADTAAASNTAAHQHSSASMVISPLHQPGAVISTTRERCGRSGTQSG